MVEVLYHLPGGAEAQDHLELGLHDSLGDREHVTDLVHFPGFDAVCGANKGTSKCAK